MPAEDTAAESGPAPWTSGPSSLEELLDQFLVENKFPGKLPGKIDEKEWLIAHGKSTFMKADRAAKLIRENTAGGQLTCLCFDSDPSLIASVVGSTVAQSLLVTTCGRLSNLVCYQI